MSSLVDKAKRFDLAHARLGTAQTKLQTFLERELDAKGRVRCYGTTSNLSQQLKNKLGQAVPIPGGLLTLSVESRSMHDRAVATLVQSWADNAGWPKTLACIGIVWPGRSGWELTTIVEWTRSVFPELVRRRLFPDVVVVQANGSPSTRPEESDDGQETYGAQVVKQGGRIAVSQTRFAPKSRALVDCKRGRVVDLDDDSGIAAAIRDALDGRL